MEIFFFLLRNRRIFFLQFLSPIKQTHQKKEERDNRFMPFACGFNFSSLLFSTLPYCHIIKIDSYSINKFSLSWYFLSSVWGFLSLVHNVSSCGKSSLNPNVFMLISLTIFLFIRFCRYLQMAFPPLRSRRIAFSHPEFIVTVRWQAPIDSYVRLLLLAICWDRSVEPFPVLIWKVCWIARGYIHRNRFAVESACAWSPWRSWTRRKFY